MYNGMLLLLFNNLETVPSRLSIKLTIVITIHYTGKLM